MSVEPVDRKYRGRTYVVRYRDADGIHRQVTPDDPTSKRAAQKLDKEIRTALWQQPKTRQPAMNMTVAQWADKYWRLHISQKSPGTQHTYASQLDRHILPLLGDMRLRDLTPETIMEFRQHTRDNGTGESNTSRVVTLLGAMLQQAHAEGLIDRNVQRLVTNPQPKRKRHVVALPPNTIEGIRWTLGTETPGVLLVSLMAYAGLRPAEVRNLRWEDLTPRTLTITATKKTAAYTRSIPLLAPLAADLSAARNGKTVGPVVALHYKSWAKNIYSKAARSMGVELPRPYDLRHSFVSLMIAEQKYSILEIARMTGHSPTMTLDTYGHIIDDWRDAGYSEDAEQRIMEARNRWSTHPPTYNT